MSCSNRNDLLQWLPALNSGSLWSLEVMIISHHDEKLQHTAKYSCGAREIESHVVVFPIQDDAAIVSPEITHFWGHPIHSTHNWTMAIAKRGSNHFCICTHTSTNSLWIHFFGNSELIGRHLSWRRVRPEACTSAIADPLKWRKEGISAFYGTKQPK